MAGKKTQLFHHVGRIFNLFMKIFCFAKVHRFLENVASMANEAREAFSQEL